MTDSGPSNTIAALAITSRACPAQWEGAMEDGRVVYVRFRHGSLSLGFGRNIGEAVEFSQTIWVEEGDRGVMELDEMLQLTGLELGAGVEEENLDDI